MTGWVKIHRKIDDWEWRSCPKTMSVFIYCLTNASHNSFRWKGRLYKPGQLPAGLRKISSVTGVSFQSIRTALTRLESTHEITQEKTSQGTIITVLNWTLYNSSTHEPTNDQQTINKRSTHTKNEKNEKNEKNKKAAANLFKSDALNNWIGLIPDATIQRWSTEYDLDKLEQIAIEAKDYYEENGYRKKSKSMYLNNWFKRQKGNDHIKQEKIHKEILDAFGKTDEELILEMEKLK